MIGVQIRLGRDVTVLSHDGFDSHEPRDDNWPEPTGVVVRLYFECIGAAHQFQIEFCGEEIEGRAARRLRERSHHQPRSDDPGTLDEIERVNYRSGT